MTDCRQLNSIPACIYLLDGTKVSGVAHFKYGATENPNELGLEDANGFTDAGGNPIDVSLIDDFDAGACHEPQVECRESQEWTFGLDNTGTRFNDTATYQVNLSDGTSFTFDQTPTGGWSAQITQWATEIQNEADALGLVWFVDARFRNPSNPTNLAGGGGLAGPPSEAVSEKLTAMLWRYVNIQICPGQPVPVSMEFVSSDQGRSGFLTTDGPIKGPLQRFQVCVQCGEEHFWYLEDGVTEADAGQIPNCWEPCGTIALAPSPPTSDCQFVLTAGCDRNNETDPVDFIPDITRRTTICAGNITTVDYFTVDPGDPTALIDYTLVDAFVDCDTGSSIPGPDPEPTDPLAPVLFPDVCANVDGEPAFVQPFRPFNTTTGDFGPVVYYDRMGNEIAGAVTEADPCDCPCDCEDITACTLMDAWDYDRGLVTAGDTSSIEIFLDGVSQAVVVHDYTTTSDGTNVSSFYDPYVAAVNAVPGWSMTLEDDVLIADQGKPTWRMEYSGSGPSELRIEYHGDAYIISVDVDGTVTTSVEDGGTPATDYGTPIFAACP